MLHSRSSGAFAVWATIAWSTCSPGLAGAHSESVNKFSQQAGSRLGMAIDPDARTMFVQTKDVGLSQAQAGMMRREVRPHVGAIAPASADAGMLTDVRTANEEADQGKDPLKHNRYYSLPPSQVIDLGPAPSPDHAPAIQADDELPVSGSADIVPSSAEPLSQASIPLDSSADTSPYGYAAPAVSGVFRTGDAPSPGVASIPSVITSGSIPLDGSIPQSATSAISGSNSLPVADGSVVAPQSVATATIYVPANLVPGLVTPTHTASIPAVPTTLGGSGATLGGSAAPSSQATGNVVHVVVGPGGTTFQNGQAHVVEGPSVSEQVDIVNDGQSGGSVPASPVQPLPAPAPETPQQREAEAEVVQFEKYVVQAEREAGLPDSIHTSTTPYNANVATQEEREELDVVMLVVFGASFIGIGGLVYYMSRNDSKKGDESSRAPLTEEEELQRQLQQQQMMQQEQQRRLNEQPPQQQAQPQ